MPEVRPLSPLRPGAVLGVFAPGSLPGAVHQMYGTRWLERRGYRVKLAPVLTGHRALDALAPLHAAPPAVRAAELEKLWFDPSVDALLAVRGGAGTLGLLEHLDLRRMVKRPKLLIGMSDVTALHCALWAAGRVPGVAGSMVVQLGTARAWTRERWIEMLGGPHLPYVVPLPPGEGPRALTRGESEGTLLPCNLSLLTRLIGTPHMPDLGGALLVLEDVSETPASVDRMLTHLDLSGALRGIAGVVLGQFTRCDGRERGVTRAHSDLVLARWVKRQRVPALAGFPHGHERLSAALPFGAQARLSTRPPYLTLLSSPWGAD